MSKRHTIKKAAAIFLGLALTVGATGCNFIVTDSQADLAQVVAEVNITDKLAEDENYSAYAASVGELIQKSGLSTEIYKRDLIAYFLNVGSAYVNNYGYSYQQTFETLMEGLTGNKILAQYAVAYYLKEGADEGITAQACLNYVETATNSAQGKEKELLQAHPEVLTMKYFLTNGGKTGKEDMEDYNKAVYSLQKSLNSSLDSAESNYIKTTSSGHSHDETRTVPTNVNATNDDYYPLKDDGVTLDYDVYTGRNAWTACGEYEPVDGSTASSRKKAYNLFLSNLDGYGLVKEGEDTAYVTELDYYYVELASTLNQALVNKYYEDLKDAAIEKLVADDYKEVKAKYQEVVKKQEQDYKADESAFETAIGSLSDTSFVLYGKDGFGFVYNILIPFSASQEQAYSAAKNKNLSTVDLYKARAEILENVTATDLRSAWFCDDEESDDHYAYEKDGKYYFFENNIEKSGEEEKYKALTQYAGKYAYQGTAEKADGEWEFTPKKFKVVTGTGETGFINEFERYVASYSGASVSGSKTTTYNTDYYKAGSKDIDYNAFILYEGKAEVGTVNNAEFFYDYDGNTAYKALSAVNELMFAYSTDTGCLNTYMGYAVSPYKTNFVAEFEYAAQKVVEKGVGAYNVVATDYGWHLVYCSFAYDEGSVYGDFNVDDVEKKGTISNLFYESLKSTAATNYTSEQQSKILNRFENSVTLYTKRYQDLLNLGS